MMTKVFPDVVNDKRNVLANDHVTWRSTTCKTLKEREKTFYEP